MWQESQFLPPSSGHDSGVHSGATTRAPGSSSGYDFDGSKMEMPVSANASADLYDMSRAAYDQGYTQQEVDGRLLHHCWVDTGYSEQSLLS